MSTTTDPQEESVMSKWIKACVFLTVCSPYAAVMVWAGLDPETIRNPLWWASYLGATVAGALALTWFTRWDESHSLHAK